MEVEDMFAFIRKLPGPGGNVGLFFGITCKIAAFIGIWITLSQYLHLVTRLLPSLYHDVNEFSAVFVCLLSLLQQSCVGMHYPQLWKFIGHLTRVGSAFIFHIRVQHSQKVSILIQLVLQMSGLLTTSSCCDRCRWPSKMWFLFRIVNCYSWEK